MAFIDITDPEKRKEIVQKYIQMRNELRIKNENRKEGNLLKDKLKSFLFPIYMKDVNS